jgi:hypothetical protein
VKDVKSGAVYILLESRLVQVFSAHGVAPALFFLFFSFWVGLYHWVCRAMPLDSARFLRLFPSRDFKFMPPPSPHSVGVPSDGGEEMET